MLNNTLPDTSRVWIYQSNRAFNEQEATLLQNLFNEFVTGWTAHSKQLIAAMELVYDRFIVITLDENAAEATGCSIDKSVHLLKQVEKEFGVNLFERQQVVYKNGDALADFHATDAEQLLNNNTITPDTIIFNNVIATKSELLTNWEKPLKDTWVGNYIGV